MKRKYYTAAVIDERGAVVAQITRYAMNSAIEATVTMVRDAARNEGTFYHGDRPERIEQVYTRRWVSDTGRVLTARASLAS
ncbi:MAG TPA: hypothetical protein VIQ30_02160 [Pseudonocardia sp.]